ncbi:MAG: sugar transferase [Leptolyngbyaceae cyanobacterium CSU_1_3]|nr:sugar transferase [Leptolyngbyaceae cyanobacterium CSU_1_3]
MNGICTLANDNVYDQLIALLNSIESILGDMPVCVYPYDNNIEKITAEIARRPNVHLYQDQASIARWDQFFREVWATNANAEAHWQKICSRSYQQHGVHRFGAHRRMCAFDGPFDRFIYMDADTLLMGEVEQIFRQLDTHDWVVYDFQYTDPGHVYNINSPKLAALLPPEKMQSTIFCSGFYAAKKDSFNQEQRDKLLSNLKEGESEILYLMSADQPVLNYMVMRSERSVYNFALELPTDQKTGCCVTSSHFVEQNHILYDRGNRLTYLHYIGLSSSLFQEICAGENVEFPYRDLFLHYRYLYELENRPVFTEPPRSYLPSEPSLVSRVLQKIKSATGV